MASQRAIIPNCDVCSEDYDAVNRIPMFLSCYHTFCLLCLLSEKTKGAAIKCRTCKELTSVDVDKENMGLEMNEKILARLEQMNFAAVKLSSDEEVNRQLYFWCLECNSTVHQQTDCYKFHTTLDLETDQAKQTANRNLRLLLGTCKNQLSGQLTKYRETDSALEAIQSALRALSFRAILRKKENDRQIKELQNELLLATNLLGKLPEETQRNGEAVHKWFHHYRDLVEKTSSIETTDFDLVRNYVVSMDIKSQDKPQLMTPLCHSDLLINFPSVGATEMEAHLLTTLSFLVLLSIQKKDRVTSVPPKKKSDTLAKQFQTKAVENNWTDEKEEAAGKEFEPKKLTRTIRRKPSDLGTIPKSLFHNKADHSGTWVNHRAGTKEQPHKGHARPHRQEPSNEQVATKLKPGHVAFQEDYQISAPVTVPSLMSSQNKKAFLALAVNGKPYGKFIIELRPDLAPVMCQKFIERCVIKDGPSYQGTIIYQSKAKTFIMGGKMPGQESLYMADVSPLRKTRGAVFFRLKRDYVKTQCSIVSTDFCIHLGDESPDNHRTSTVFGYVCDGLAVCDAISYLDCCNRDHVAISSAGLVD